MISVAKRALKALGFQLSRISKEEDPSPVQVAIHTLLATQDRIKIVQVGANDGAVGDPLYPVVFSHPSRCDVLLIEPQTNLLPYLTKNYAFHPAPVIHNGAIGASGQMVLYAIKPEAWKDLDVPYARGWQDYRAPTGVTSADRERVAQWLKRFYKGKSAEDQLIEEVHVESSPLVDVLERHRWEHRIDVLQIDAEGFDDQVIYHSSLEITKPRVINFEIQSLAGEKRSALFGYLAQRGYAVSPYGNDAIAIRTNDPERHGPSPAT